MVDDDDYELLKIYNWYCNDGRAVRKNGRSSTILMHRQIMNLGSGDKRIIDHINGNPLDNRKENLRICQQQQNMYNRRKNSNNTSGIKGVSWSNIAKKWKAQIRINKKAKHLGYFDNIEDAAKAYEAAAIVGHGQYINLG